MSPPNPTTPAGLDDDALPGGWLRRATVGELGDSLLLPVTGHPVGFLLAGFGQGLQANYLLATPDEVNLQVRVSEGQREYDLPTMTCVSARGAPIQLDLDHVHLYRFDTPCHDYLRFYLVCHTDRWAKDFLANMATLAFDAARSADDWHLENSLNWCQGEAEAAAGTFRPNVGFTLAAPLSWRLSRPLFRQYGADMLFEWEVVAPAGGERQPKALARCATTRDGEVVRKSDLELVALLGRATGRQGAARARFGALPD